MKKIVLLSILLLTGLMAQTTQDTVNIPTNRDIANTLVAYGMTSMMIDALSPTYETFDNQVASSLVKVIIVMAAKQYANKEKPKKFYTQLLQVVLVAMVYYDLKAYGGL